MIWAGYVISQVPTCAWTVNYGQNKGGILLWRFKRFVGYNVNVYVTLINSLSELKNQAAVKSCVAGDSFQ